MFTNSIEHQILDYPSRPSSMVMERNNWEPKIELAPNCPRCASSNTKFCYYNNYSLSQPRYFCKGCKRYWTKGGSLRNVPVGGGCRKSRRAKSARGTAYPRQNPSPNSSATNESDNSSNGAEIDLAAVFANYLNQDNQESSSGTSSGSLDLPFHHQDFMFDQCQKPSHDLTDSIQFNEGFPQENVDDLMEFQSILGDEIEQEMIWPEDNTSLQDFPWQSMVEMEDFGSFPMDDHSLKMSNNNVVIDNWSSFDLSGYDFLSKS